MRLKRGLLYKFLNLFIAAVWLVNGLFCKVLNFVPRHEQIVAGILGGDYSRPLIIFIGLAEIGMAYWILTKYRSKLNAIIQIVLVATMNILEFVIVPDLLLWGRLNSVFALLFITIVFYNEFFLNKKLKLQIAT